MAEYGGVRDLLISSRYRIMMDQPTPILLAKLVFSLRARAYLPQSFACSFATGGYAGATTDAAPFARSVQAASETQGFIDPVPNSSLSYPSSRFRQIMAFETRIDAHHDFGLASLSLLRMTRWSRSVGAPASLQHYYLR